MPAPRGHFAFQERTVTPDPGPGLRRRNGRNRGSIYYICVRHLLHMCTTFTTYVYTIYYICVRNLLQRSVRHSSGPRSLRQRPYRPSSEVGCCMSRLRGVPKVGAPACQAPGELKGTRSEAKTASNTPPPPPPSPPINIFLVGDPANRKMPMLQIKDLSQRHVALTHPTNWNKSRLNSCA